MKRSFLEDLGIPKESINEIMKMHGQSRNEAADLPSATELQEETEALRQQAAELKDKIEQLESIDIGVETTKLEQEIEGYKSSMLKMKIASEYNIPFNLTDRLSGTNEEELRTDAENLSSYIEGPKVLLPLKSTELEKAPDNPYRTMLRELTY